MCFVRDFIGSQQFYFYGETFQVLWELHRFKKKLINILEVLYGIAIPKPFMVFPWVNHFAK